MAGINQMVGGIAAGITNGSDFSRYAKGPKHYVGRHDALGLDCWCAGLVCRARHHVCCTEDLWGNLLKIRLSHLYRTADTSYWFWHGVNWRALVAWPCGWIPTIGGLVLTTLGKDDGPRGLYQLYYMAFLMGFSISSILFYTLNKLFPVPGMGEYDDIDFYGTLSPDEAAKLGVIPCDRTAVIYGDHSNDLSATQVAEAFDDKKGGTCRDDKARREKVGVPVSNDN
ncbi:hypothetical protein M406DRAFT_67063, partial [Cryphonectria parasitica EP155]